MISHRSDLSPTEAQPWLSLVPADLFYARLADWRSVCSRRRCEDYISFYRISQEAAHPSHRRWLCSLCCCSTTTTCPDDEVKQRMRSPHLRWNDVFWR
jgi:hypothetical protein